MSGLLAVRRVLVRMLLVVRLAARAEVLMRSWMVRVSGLPAVRRVLVRMLRVARVGVLT